MVRLGVVMSSEEVVLKMVIPKGGTAPQIEKINKAVEYGSNKNITVNIKVVR